MSWRPHSHARVSARNPEAFAKCDRCGSIDNLVDLSYQHEWAGPKLINKRLKVCPSCLDRPQPQLRELRLRPDPVPVRDPRPLNNAAVTGGYAVMQRSVAAHGGLALILDVVPPVGIAAVAPVLTADELAAIPLSIDPPAA